MTAVLPPTLELAERAADLGVFSGSIDFSRLGELTSLVPTLWRSPVQTALTNFSEVFFPGRATMAITASAL